MKRFIKYCAVALCIALTVPSVTSCDDSDDFNTQQYKGGVNLNVFGPCPVARGGELRFLGSGMDQITKITLPGSGDITEIDVISSEEIRITVPQNAEPGTVVLHYAGGTIETKTPVSFSEPISIDEITPLTVKPGDVLTINGEYLNLINEVCFPFSEGCDSVNVFKADFLEHSRKTISLNVPAEAISGLIIISDAKEMPNTIKAEVAIDVVLPSVEAPLDLTKAKGGDEITISGKDFDLIKSIEMPDGSEVEFTFDAENSKVTFTLPDNSSDGAIVAVTASKAKVVLANIGMVVPTEMVATPAVNIKAGETVSVKGLNMDQVVSILLPNMAEAFKPASISNSELTFEYPADAWGGNAVFNLKSGKTVELPLAAAVPQMTGVDKDPAPAGSTITLFGRNMDLVSEIVFSGSETAVKAENQTETELSLIVPATAQSGELKFIKENGEITVAEIKISTPECAYVVSMNTEDPMAGEIMQFTIKNGDKLQAVKVNGADVQYICNGDKLFVNLPSSCGKNTVVTLISSNGTLEYTYDVTPASHVEIIVSEELYNTGNWDGGGMRLYKESFQGVPAGAKLLFHLSAANDAQLQLNDANWKDFAYIDVPAGSTIAEYVLTADILNLILTTEDGWSSTAIVVNGHDAIISKVTLEYEQSSETEIWSGKWSSGNWSGNQDLAYGAFDWSSVKAGSILRLYVTPEVASPADDWWCVALRHGDGWNMLPAPCPDQWGQPVSGVVELELTQGILDDLVANGGLIISGADYTLTRVTIE